LKVSGRSRERLKGARKFLAEFKRYKFGIVGIVIIVFFGLLAVLAPFLTSYDPIFSYNLATPYSIPAWARIFPQYSNYPVSTQLLNGTDLSGAGLGSWSVAAVQSNTPAGGTVNYERTSSGLLVTFKNPQPAGLGQTSPTFYFNQTISYPWAFACHYETALHVTSLGGNLSNQDLQVNEYIKSVSGKIYHVFGPDLYTNIGDHFAYTKAFPNGTLVNLFLSSSDVYSNLLATNSLSPTSLGQCGLPQAIFGHAGNLTLSYAVTADKSTKVLFSYASLYLQGRAFGILGTDDLGRDVWSQFVYGSRVSLIVGIVASVIAVAVGTIVGIAAGYLGGILDEVLMRFTDFMLILPFLPLLLIIITIISVGNLHFPFGNEFLIIIVIAVFSWEGIARIIRAQVLSLRSRQFVEASRGLGGKSGHIMTRHILPNVTGLIYANMALTVPGAILTEAAVTFLGFGDPTIISWGSMVSRAQEAVTSPIHSFVWWWFLPPGLAIAVLSMAFLFVGFALDSVLNPRLRRR
jgi:peptide/nickel transport system permease protein